MADAAGVRADREFVPQTVGTEQQVVGDAELHRTVDADALAVLAVGDLIVVLREVEHACPDQIRGRGVLK